MNPTRVWAKHYRSFEHLDLPLPGGCVAIVGPNGAGKSSILGVIDLALFGSRDLGAQLTAGSPEGEMEVGLEFEHRDELYRVRRSYSRKGRGQTKLYFERFGFHEGGALDPREWHPLTRETQKATQALLEETLGLTRQTLRASALLMQGDGAAFTEAEPRDRKAILSEILGLSLWERLQERAREDKREVGEATARALGALERVEGAVSERPALEEALAASRRAEETSRKAEVAGGAEAERVREQLARLAAEAAKREAALRLVESCEKREGDAGRRLAALEREAATLDERLAEKPSLEESAGGIEALVAEAASAREAENAHQVWESKRNALAADVAAAGRAREEAAGFADAAREAYDRALAEVSRLQRDEVEDCPACGQPLQSPEAREALRAKLVAAGEQAEKARDETADRMARAQEAEAEARRAAEALEEPGSDVRPAAEIERELAEARGAQGKLVGLAEVARRRESIDRESAAATEERDAAAAEGAKAREALGDVAEADPEPARRQLEKLEGAVREVRERADAAGREVARLEERLSTVDAAEREAQDLRDRLPALEDERDVLTALERAFGRDGVPALIVENRAVPQLEMEANRILGDLGTSLRVELRTQRELKGGEGQREALDVVVSGEDGGQRLYESCSGGERTRVNLALRIALARLLAHRRGAEVRLLAIDEPEFLDEDGVARLAEVLQGLSDDFERVILISHLPALREAFDVVLQVSRSEDGGSRASFVGGVPEAVPA